MIQKTAGSNNAWDAGAVSSRAIQSGDGYIQVTVDETSGRRAFGLSRGNTNAKRGDIDFAAQIGDGVLRIFEGGSNRGTFATIAVGDRVKVAVEAGVVRYYLNDTVVYNSRFRPSYPLLLDTSISTMGSRITNAMICSRNLGP